MIFDMFLVVCVCVGVLDFTNVFFCVCVSMYYGEFVVLDLLVVLSPFFVYVYTCLYIYIYIYIYIYACVCVYVCVCMCVF